MINLSFGIDHSYLQQQGPFFLIKKIILSLKKLDFVKTSFVHFIYFNVSSVVVFIFSSHDYFPVAQNYHLEAVWTTSSKFIKKALKD